MKMFFDVDYIFICLLSQPDLALPSGCGTEVLQLTHFQFRQDNIPQDI